MTDYSNVNKVNTPLSAKFLNDLHEEVQEGMMEYLNSIPFIQALIAKDRPYANELERWDHPHLDTVDNNGNLVRKTEPNGRIRLNYENPHILEDTDFFRPAAIYFKKHGKYTDIIPDKNPYGAYKKFWKEEMRRCWEGYIRPSDGEWITGYHYFYLNYSPVMKTVTDPITLIDERIQDFPDFYDGDYWFFHYIERARVNKRHCVSLKKRGAGYSLKGAGQLGRNFILGETKNVRKNVNSFAIANEKEYLVKDGVLNKFVDVIDFCAENTPFPRKKLKNSLNAMTWVMGYEDSKTDMVKGTGNMVGGVTLKNDPERARGKRGVFILWEEFGKFDNSLKAWLIGIPSVQDGNSVFGLMSAFGTGGTATAAFTGLRELFYKPKGYKVYALPNVFDKNAKKGSICGFFHAGYLNRVGCMDKNGNSDIIAALISIIEERIDLKYNSDDPSALTQSIAEMALTPQEAIMRVGGSIFNTVDIKNYLEDCRINQNTFVENHLVGDLVIDHNGAIEFINNFDKIPIRKYKADPHNQEGAVEIFSLPEIDTETKRPYSGRYIAGIDPIDNDYIKNGSLGSIFVFDLWNDEIVAEYTGRPQLAEDFYEICRRMIIFYNGVGNYESNIKGLFGYFSNKNQLHLLADTPNYLKDVDSKNQRYTGTSAKGTRSNAYNIDDGLRKQKSWMSTKLNKIRTNDLGDEEEYEISRLREIRSLGYLEELYEYSPDGNFDRVMAMNMVMFLREELSRFTEINKDKTEDIIEEDEFIKANYDDILGDYNEQIKLEKYYGKENIS